MRVRTAPRPTTEGLGRERRANATSRTSGARQMTWPSHVAMTLRTVPSLPSSPSSSSSSEQRSQLAVFGMTTPLSGVASESIWRVGKDFRRRLRSPRHCHHRAAESMLRVLRLGDGRSVMATPSRRRHTCRLGGGSTTLPAFSPTLSSCSSRVAAVCRPSSTTMDCLVHRVTL